MSKATVESNRIAIPLPITEVALHLYNELFDAAKELLHITPVDEWTEKLDRLEAVVAEIEVMNDE